ncbi:MAG: tetratricopeptide repeat protein [Candidatus Zixiibacteriota bacterium]
MTVCSNCRAEQPSSDTRTCIHCGYPIATDTDMTECESSENASVDFLVTETADENRQLVGGSDNTPLRDDLGIESTTDLMEQEAQKDAFGSQRPFDAARFDTPIGESAPPPPPAADPNYPACDTPVQAITPTAQSDDSVGSVKKLSAEEIKKIEQNLYGSKSFLKDKDVQQLRKRVAEATKESASPGTSEAVLDPEQPSTKKDGRPRKGIGIAYYYKNYVHVLGSHSLMTNDTLKVNDREYLLKPKKIKPTHMVAAVGTLFIILMGLMVAIFTSGSGSGEGHLVGVVLDEYNQPYLMGATIRLPERNATLKSDASGFFAAGLLPVGTYQVDYLLEDQLVQTEQVTVTEDEVRMVLLRPGSPQRDDTPVARAERPAPSKQPVQPQLQDPAPAVTKPEPSAPLAAKTEPVVPAKPASTKSTTTSTKTSSSAPGKVTLQANVDGARFELDGSVLGAGNLTYSKIKPGTHRYRVESDGYNAVEGSFSLASGEDYKLSVTLTPMKQAEKAQRYKKDDYFHAAESALKNGDYATAVNDFTEAIKFSPSNADAYYRRAQAHAGLKMYRESYDDYLRAGEIYRMKKDLSSAMNCFNAAIELDANSTAAYLGRADLYLSRGDILASLADYDKVVSLDNRNFQGYYGLGEARFKQQQYKKAIKHFKDARSVESENPLVHQYLVLSYLAIADEKNVKKSYEKFVEVATDEQMKQFKADQRYSTVQRIVESQ